MAVSLLMAFAEMMAPRGNLRKAVDMVIALVIIAAVIGPILEIGSALVPVAGRLGRSDFRGDTESVREAAATGMRICLQQALEAAFPGMAQGWRIYVGSAQSRARVQVEVDTSGQAAAEFIDGQVATVVSACLGIDVRQVVVK